MDEDKWKIKVYDTAKNNLPMTEGMELGVIPKFPSMMLLVGKSGSGKSNLLVGLCKDPALMGNFYDEIYFISPTADVDDLVEHLKLKKENVWSDLDEAVKDLGILMDNQAHDVERYGIAKTPKVLVVVDDCIGNKAFMKSDILTKLAIHGRHNLMSSIICTQSYTKVPRAIRLQAAGLALFPSSQNEVKLLIEDYCPANHSKKSFEKIVKFATDEPHQFLFIQNHCKKMKERYRKNLGLIIDLKD
jgi:energy-coupling factor transporter ATP-binding protein EcfA2